MQSNETDGSTRMELEGLKRSLNLFENRAINIKTLVTDRHVSVRKYIREQKPNVLHYFDVWHVSKSK